MKYIVSIAILALISKNTQATRVLSNDAEESPKNEA